MNNLLKFYPSRINDASMHAIVKTLPVNYRYMKNFPSPIIYAIRCYLGHQCLQFTDIYISITENQFPVLLSRTCLSLTWRASAGCALISDRVVEFLTCLRMKTTTLLLLRILVRDFGESSINGCIILVN